jgi:hypothetical protein
MSVVRSVWLCAAMILPVMSYGCSSDPEVNGDGGSGGSGGTGGTGGSGGSLVATINDLCTRLDDCNELEGLSAIECTEIVAACVDESFVIPSLKEDWALLVRDCKSSRAAGSSSIVSPGWRPAAALTARHVAMVYWIAARSAMTATRLTAMVAPPRVCLTRLAAMALLML